MECRPPKNNQTEIMENYVHRDQDRLEERFLSFVELGEYKKIQEVFLTFLKSKPKNKSDLRKSLFNIAASLMRILAILEDTLNQETTSCGVKNCKANHICDEYDNSSTKDQSISKKINRHLGQKNDEQIPRVTMKIISRDNNPGYVARIDRSLQEYDECRINMQKPDSENSQYIGYLQKITSQTLVEKDEICNAQLNNETEIVFECKNVEPSITSVAQHKSDYSSHNQFQYLEISEATRSTIKDERVDMVKKEDLNDNIEKLNSNNNCKTNGQNKIIPTLKSIHSSNESEKLETCSKKLKNNSNLKVHTDTAHNHITLSCDICEKKFTQKTKLKIHTEVVHNGRKLYQCDTCGKTFLLKNKLERHINSNHIDLACDASRKTIAQKNYFINHIDSVNNGKKSNDRVTRGQAFRPKVALKKHIESPRRSITHTCDSCEKTFKTKVSLKNHIDFVHKNLKRHKCDECQKYFSCKTSLNLHMSAMHNGVNYTCDLCEKIFTQKGNLRVHIDIVHMRNEKLYKCDECKKSFNYKCDLTSHIEYAHKGITYPCDLCEKVFRQKSSLGLHKDSVHNGITHPCDLCKKVFTQNGNLKKHKDSVHNGITHPCDLCKKVFTQNGNLKKHKDSVHNGITHPCDLCKKVFSQKSYLKVHKDSLHNGIAHPCDQSEKSFTQKYKLKLHINEVHNGKK